MAAEISQLLFAQPWFNLFQDAANRQYTWNLSASANFTRPSPFFQGKGKHHPFAKISAV
jgi:hypothetical protein